MNMYTTYRSGKLMCVESVLKENWSYSFVFFSVFVERLTFIPKLKWYIIINSQKGSWWLIEFQWKKTELTWYMQYHCNLNLYILYRYQKTLCTDVFGHRAYIVEHSRWFVKSLIVVAPQFWLNSAYNVHMDIHTWTFQFQYGNVLFPLDIVLHLVFKWAQEMWTTVSSFSNYTVYSYWSHVNGWTDMWSVHEIS